jgi:hypothetical protein
VAVMINPNGPLVEAGSDGDNIVAPRSVLAMGCGQEREPCRSASGSALRKASCNSAAAELELHARPM